MSRSLTALLLLLPGVAFAEGSADTNYDPNGPTTPNYDPQVLDARASNGNVKTFVYVDILAATEDITFSHTGTLQLYTENGTTSLGTFSNGQSYTNAAVGTYRVEYAQDQTTWDISVSGTAAGRGRVWSKAWSFVTNNFDESSSTFASFYALVDGGDASHNGVVEMKTHGLAGNVYTITANRDGIQGANGRSVPQDGTFHDPPADYSVYLNPPEIATYDPLVPVISAVGFDYDSACDQVTEGVSEASFLFTSNVSGTYHIVCDLNDDGLFDFTTDGDLHLIGRTNAQSQIIDWDGTDNQGNPIPANPDGTPRDYDCIAFVTVGEFHYAAGDIESSFSGFRLFRVDESPSLVRSSLPMYWNDELVQDDEWKMWTTTPLANGAPGLVSSGALGIQSGTYPDATVCQLGTPPSPYPTSPCPIPNVNARSWGNFSDNDAPHRCSECINPPIGGCPTTGCAECDEIDEVYHCSKGDWSWLDTYTWLDASLRAEFTITVGSLDDQDGDELLDAEEDCLYSTDFDDEDSDDDGLLDGEEVLDAGTDPNDADSDGDGIGDLIEVGADPANPESSDSDSLIDALDPDDDNDGIPTLEEHVLPDGDDDGKPNHLDTDSDDDGLLDSVEGNVQSDGDGDPDFLDTDSDDDTLLDGVEGTPDSDGDGAEDFRDTDSDNDTLLDGTEGVTDSDGDALLDYQDPDDDNDTIPTVDEAGRGDTDGDGKDDHLDEDDDDDGILTAIEAADAADYGDGGSDVDEDGDDNWYDTDADGDGVLDGPGGTEGDHEGRDDTDRDDVLDYLDPDGAYTFAYSGSCLLSTGGAAPTGALAGLLALLAAVGVRRRRGASLAALAALFVVGTAHAGDGAEISKSTGRPGQVVVLWPRVVPSAASDEVLLVAGALQDRLVTLAEQGAPDLVRNVRPEPERVCPKGGGCKAPSVNVLLAHHEGGCVVVGWVSAPGKSPAQLVPLAGRLQLSATEAEFRDPPESLVTVQDFAECATVADHLDPAGVAKLQELLKAAE